MKRHVIINLGLILIFSLLSHASVFAAGSSPELYNVTTYAGSGEYKANNGEALASAFRSPTGITILKDGSLLVADSQNQLIRQVKDGQVSTYAGLTFDTDDFGLPEGGLVNGAAAQSIFQSPMEIEADGFGNLYVADADNNVIRKIDTKGNVTVLAGDPDGVGGLTDGRGSKAKFNHPTDLVVTSGGTIYVADTLNHVIRKVTSIGTVTTLNATSERSVQAYGGEVEPTGDFKDGKLGEALFNEPSGLALDVKGNLYVSDSGNQVIRYIDLAAGTVTTVAGSNEVVYETDALYAVGDYADGSAAQAKFDFPKGLALTEEGGLLIADSQNNAIRYMVNGEVITIVGTLNADFGNIDGAEKSARLHHPTDIAVTANGDIYVADSYNNKIRLISRYQLPESVKQTGSIHVLIGTEEVQFDAKPVMKNQRVMVPVRAIAEALGYTVQTSDNQTIVMTKADMTITFTIGSADVARTDGTAQSSSKVDAIPFIQDNRSYVPVRFISEQLDKQVDWNQQFTTVIIR